MRQALEIAGIAGGVTRPRDHERNARVRAPSWRKNAALSTLRIMMRLGITELAILLGVVVVLVAGVIFVLKSRS